MDADPRNLAYLRTSLDLNNSTRNVRMFFNAVRLVSSSEAPWINKNTYDDNVSQQRGDHTASNFARPNQQGGVPHVHRWFRHHGWSTGLYLPACIIVRSNLQMQESKILLNQATIEAEHVILKIDIEGYECKALPKEIILGSSGKWIPFIFIEWGWLVSFCSLMLDLTLDRRR